MTTQQIAAQPGEGAPHVMPRAGSRDGTAPLRSDPAQVVQLVLFVVGALLLPAGLIVIGLSWYGTAHTPYAYDQMSYLVSGIFGLGVTFVGGFLYFGSWLARIASDQKNAQRQLADTVLGLADSVTRNTSAGRRDAGADLVVAGGGTTVHRADCDLVAGRDDLRPAGATAGLTPCRVCQPPSAS
ncbi:MAG: hypothetical protein JWR83_1227 [Aeromicrobium sp.]|nr:hypothetical protein [Aeromicrobium sp.]